MAINIDNNFIRQFGDNFEAVAQQMGSKLRAAVREQRVRGKDFTIERMTNPNNELPVVTSRHADTVISDLSHSRRTASIVNYVRSYMIDDEDKVKMLLDPTSEYVSQIAGEMNRTIDLRIIEAALGNAYSGETGGTAVSLPSGQKIAHGSAALTLAKVKQALRILMANDVDVDRADLVLACPASGYEDLMSDSGLVSVDFSQYKPNMDGKVPVVAGFKVIHAQRISDYSGSSAASTNRPAIAMTNRAVRLGIAQDQLLDVSREPLKNLNHIVTLKTGFGATRPHDEEVVDIRFQE